METTAALAWPDQPMTPKADVQHELGELASTLSAYYAEQRDGHRRLRDDLTSLENKIEAAALIRSDILKELALVKQGLKDLQDRAPEAAKLRFSGGIVYSIAATAVIIVGVIYGLYQSAHVEALANQTAIHDMVIRDEAREKVDAAERRLREIENNTVASSLARLERETNLNTVYITGLKERGVGR